MRARKALAERALKALEAIVERRPNAVRCECTRTKTGSILLEFVDSLWTEPTNVTGVIAAIESCLRSEEEKSKHKTLLSKLLS